MDHSKGAQWRTLHAEALKAILDPLRFGYGLPSGSSARVLMSTWIEPAFQEATSWSVVRSRSGKTGDDRLFVRRISWDRECNAKLFENQTVVLPGDPALAPKIRFEDADLPGTEWDARYRTLLDSSIQTLGSVPPISIDGTGFGLELFGPVAVRLCWRNSGPEGWRSAIDWVGETREWFDSL